jgi:UDPglucose 6-dehydrogenase
MKKTLILYIILLASPNFSHSSQLKTAIIGTGYVGLVTGTGLAELGNHVTCADINVQKIKGLIQGVMPIYENGLESLVKKNSRSGYLSFTSDIPAAIKQADILFIAVDTPMSESGAADLTAIRRVIGTIAEHINHYTVIATKSTVPIGTSAWIREILETEYDIPADMFDVISNPEFLREGSAVYDFLNPDRIVIGFDSERARQYMEAIYAPFIVNDIPIIWTNITTAESIKYASNAFLALKLSFINEMANLCDAMGADIQDVSRAMGLDKRISPQFLHPGPGFGGSCFPKDSAALLYMAKQNNLPFFTIEAAINANNLQKHKPVQKLLNIIPQLNGTTVAVLGLAFKANTDDIRYSPAITIIEDLIKEGACVRVYDPAAMANMRSQFPFITYCNSIEEVITNADAAILATEWQEFKEMDLAKIGQLMNSPIIIDMRNILDKETLQNNNFIFDYIGRSCLRCAYKNVDIIFESNN